MMFSSCLTDDHRPLVLDTSVLINLHACTHGGRVLLALKNDIVVPEIVAGELEHETSQTNGEQRFLRNLIEQGSVIIAHLTDAESELFAALVGGSPALDDGEAATVAVAASRGWRAVIDETKGRARAQALMNGEVPAWSLDLLLHQSVTESLGAELTSDVVYVALRDGRMRIPPESVHDVVALIGRHRAADCTSLPGFKTLFRAVPSPMPKQE